MKHCTLLYTVQLQIELKSRHATLLNIQRNVLTSQKKYPDVALNIMLIFLIFFPNLVLSFTCMIKEEFNGSVYTFFSMQCLIFKIARHIFNHLTQLRISTCKIVRTDNPDFGIEKEQCLFTFTVIKLAFRFMGHGQKIN